MQSLMASEPLNTSSDFQTKTARRRADDVRLAARHALSWTSQLTKPCQIVRVTRVGRRSTSTAPSGQRLLIASLGFHLAIERCGLSDTLGCSDTLHSCHVQVDRSHDPRALALHSVGVVRALVLAATCVVSGASRSFTRWQTMLSGRESSQPQMALFCFGQRGSSFRGSTLPARSSRSTFALARGRTSFRAVAPWWPRCSPPPQAQHCFV